MPTLTSETLATDGTPSHARDLKSALRNWAGELAFDALRVTTPNAIEAAGDRLLQFLAEGRHGTMTWMETAANRRRDPRALWPEAQSIILIAMSYAPEDDPLEALALSSRGAISVYAKGRDYHDVLKGKLKDLAGRLERATGEAVKVFVDTAPLMEKPLAAAAGLGWQGKHTNLVSREHGSWLFLGAILTAAKIEPDEPEKDHCGSCRRCLEVCPTASFPGPYQLDARRCIAYLTIEHKGHIAREFRVPIGNRIFGCDDCLAVCPWNKFASKSREMRFAATEATDNPPLAKLLTLDDASFRKAYAGTPIKRTGRDRFIRNVLIAVGNSGETEFIPLVTRLLSDAAPIVRAMAIWALRRLADPATLAATRTSHLLRERDDLVRDEWTGDT
ncbi:MAG: tRNA epoxyqueuosine(34) reductase QueG [Hyphomicrobium sp.]|jgi:epoxyqueuosine reductase